MHTPPVVALVGPTAIGKTALSLTIAREHRGEIISVDSMQVYRYMDIGTAKIRPAEMAGIRHHLIDIIDPDEEYDAAQFVQDATKAIMRIDQEGNQAILAGGTGLYLKALVEGLFEDIPQNREIRRMLQQRVEIEGTLKLHEELALCDPDSAHKIHPNDRSRIVRGLEIYLTTHIPWSEHLRRQETAGKKGGVTHILQIGLTCDRQKLYDRINKRCQIMLDEGLEEEVRSLLAMGYSRKLRSMGSIGYRHMLNYIDGIWNQEEMLTTLQRDTRRYAKRQYTWFSKIADLEWFDISEPERIFDRVEQYLNQYAA